MLQRRRTRIVDIRFYDANREDPDEYDELTVWATRDGKTKGRVEVELDGEPVGLISATPFEYTDDAYTQGEDNNRHSCGEEA